MMYDCPGVLGYRARANRPDAMPFDLRGLLRAPVISVAHAHCQSADQDQMRGHRNVGLMYTDPDDQPLRAPEHIDPFHILTSSAGTHTTDFSLSTGPALKHSYPSRSKHPASAGRPWGRAPSCPEVPVF